MTLTEHIDWLNERAVRLRITADDFGRVIALLEAPARELEAIAVALHRVINHRLYLRGLADQIERRAKLLANTYDSSADPPSDQPQRQTPS